MQMLAQASATLAHRVRQITMVYTTCGRTTMLDDWTHRQPPLLASGVTSGTTHPKDHGQVSSHQHIQRMPLPLILQHGVPEISDAMGALLVFTMMMQTHRHHATAEARPTVIRAARWERTHLGRL